ncbi:OmpA family protein, partial [Bacteroides cellulosilyticus]
MKSKLVILSLLLSGATIANAQTKEKYYSESWKDNFFISVGVGGQVVTNPSNFDYGFGESITPLVNISLGKFFSPVWGIRGQVAGWSGKLHTQYPFENVGKDENWYNYKKKFVALNADAM